jgi:hypothetical protein
MAQETNQPLISDAFANAPNIPDVFYMQSVLQVALNQIYLTTEFSQAVQNVLADELVVFARRVSDNFIVKQY